MTDWTPLRSSWNIFGTTSPSASSTIVPISFANNSIIADFTSPAMRSLQTPGGFPYEASHFRYLPHHPQRPLFFQIIVAFCYSAPLPMPMSVCLRHLRPLLFECQVVRGVKCGLGARNSCNQIGIKAFWVVHFRFKRRHFFEFSQWSIIRLQGNTS